MGIVGRGGAGRGNHLCRRWRVSPVKLSLEGEVMILGVGGARGNDRDPRKPLSTVSVSLTRQVKL